MNWKDKINELALKGLISYGTEEDLKDFISKEIIEPLIDEIPNDQLDLKQKLKSKWL